MLLRVPLMCCAVLMAVAPVIPAQELPAAVGAPSAMRLRFGSDVDRSSQEWSQAVESLLANGRVLEATQLLARVPSGASLTDHGVVVSRDWYLQALVPRLSTAERLRHHDDMRAEARQAWEAARADGTPAALMSFCRRYGHLPQGVTAWRDLAVRARDRRAWRQSLAAWSELSRHPSADPQERAWAILGQIECLMRLSRFAEAEALFAEQEAVLADTRLPVGGESRPATQAARHLLATGPASLPPVVAVRPSLSAVWSHPTSPLGELSSSWQQWQDNLRAHGVTLLPATQVIVAGPIAVLRTPSGLQASELETGKVLWDVVQEDWSWLQTHPGELTPVNFRDAVFEQLGRRIFADTVFGRLTADAERVYAIQAVKETQGRAKPGPIAPNDESNQFRSNYLVAHSLKTGQLVWRIGGEATGSTYRLGGVYFCGPPLRFDESLYVIAQQETELLLLAINADTGELQWRQVLGDLPRTMNADPARQRIACEIREHQGVLLCTTAAGAVIAVDPLLKSVRWGARYGISARPGARSQRVDGTSRAPDAWWDGWRETSIVCEGNTAVVTSPESDALHALDIATGKLLWSVPRTEGTLVLSAAADGLIIVESSAVRKCRWSDGHEVWRTETPVISGRGVTTSDAVIVPLLTNELACLDRTTGAALPAWGRFAAALGNLSSTPWGWLNATESELALLPELATAGTSAEDRLRQQPLSAAARIQAARCRLEANELEAAGELLEGMAEPEADALRNTVIAARLERQPELWRSHRDQLPSQGSSSKRAEHVLRLSDAARRTGDVVASGEILLDAIAQLSREEMVPLWTSRRRVRADLAFLGAWTDLRAAASPEQQQSLEQLLVERWNKAKTGTDPFAVQRWSEALQPLEFVERRLEDDSAAQFLGQPLQAVELRLLAAAQSSDPKIADSAGTLLEQELEHAGFRQEAMAYRRSRRRLIEPFPREAWHDWPAVTPLAEPQPGRNDDVYQFAIPLDAASTPFFDRLDVAMERQARSVRFGGAGNPGVWDVTLPPPTSFRFHKMVQGWGRGRVLVLRLGFELMALAVVNERGEPAGRVLWQLQTAGGTLASMDRFGNEILPAKAGIREETTYVFDEFGRYAAEVGPVTPTFLCYGDRGILKCIETWTGRLRWERENLPPATLLRGDRDVIVLWQPRRQQVEWLRSLDGRTLGRRTWEGTSDDIVAWDGVQVCRRSMKSAPELWLENIITGEVLWRRPLSLGETPFALDQQLLGIADPGGRLILLERATGRERSRVEIEGMPAAIDRVTVSRDGETYYLGLSEQVPQQAGLQLSQLRGDRQPFLTGPLVAIDRDRQSLVWQTRLNREPWLIEQPRAAPVLWQVYKQPPEDLQSNRHTPGVVKLRDKRTGDLLYRREGTDLMGYAALASFADRGLVNLFLERDTIRLRYRPHPPPPALPDP